MKHMLNSDPSPNVVCFEPVSEDMGQYINKEYIEQFDAVLNIILPEEIPAEEEVELREKR